MDIVLIIIAVMRTFKIKIRSEHGFMQEMTNREYVEDQDAEEPDDFIISLTAQVYFLFC